MSIIAIRWAYSQPIESPVAKNVLVFLCTHDFPGNTSVFKINTICKATGYSEKPVRNALNELHKLKYINKQERFGENGQKISNSYTILVPPEYVQKFTEDYELLTAPRSEQPVPRSQRPVPPGRRDRTIRTMLLSTILRKAFVFHTKIKKMKIKKNMNGQHQSHRMTLNLRLRIIQMAHTSQARVER